MGLIPGEFLEGTPEWKEFKILNVVRSEIEAFSSSMMNHILEDYVATDVESQFEKEKGKQHEQQTEKPTVEVTITRKDGTKTTYKKYK